MQILRLTDSDERIQSSALARKLRAKIMQKVASIEIPPHSQNEEIDIPENVEEIVDLLLKSLADRVYPLRCRINIRIRLYGIRRQKLFLESLFRYLSHLQRRL
jgi:hypothetical protein